MWPDVTAHHLGAPEGVNADADARWFTHLVSIHHLLTKKYIIDGREREDVLDYRIQYLRKLEILELTHAHPPACNDEAICPALLNQRRKNWSLFINTIIQVFGKRHVIY